jgi:hypothetical protein
MTKTAKQLALDIAGGLNMLRPGEPFEADDEAVIIQRYRDLHAELVDRQVIYWPWDSIPDAVFNRLSEFCQVEVAPRFGALPIVLAALGVPNKAAAHEMCLRKLRLHVEKEFNFEYEKIIQF